MPSGLGVIVFIGAGYLLVYAAVANGGRFAAAPWAGLMEDAYTGSRGGGAAAAAMNSVPWLGTARNAHTAAGAAGAAAADAAAGADTIRPRRPRHGAPA